MVPSSNRGEKQDLRKESILSQMRNQPRKQQKKAARQRVSELTPNQKILRLELVFYEDTLVVWSTQKISPAL